jgi:hypothetical protein
MPNTHPFLKTFGLAALVVIPIVVLTATSGADPGTAGEQAGTLAVGPLVAAVAVGLWAKRAVHRWRGMDYVWRFVMCAIVAAALNDLGRRVLSATTGSSSTESSASQPSATPLTDEEKQYFNLSGGWVRHTFFDFTMPVGDKFRLAPDIQSEMNQQLTNQGHGYAWAIQNERDNEIILVLVIKGVGDEKDDFRSFTRGMDKGIRPRAARILENKFRWDRQLHEFRHGAHLSDGVYLRTRCLTSGPRSSKTYIVCAQTLSSDSPGLTRPLEYFTVRGWS